MRGFIEELKAAVTGLGRAPAFTALAAGVLGLGLGAVIFMYSVADTLMMKPPPYPDADRMYLVATIDGQTAGDYDDYMQPLDYLKVREAAGQFESIGSIYVGTTYLTGDGQAERYDGGFADGYVFDVIGVAPELGRTILPRDTIEGAALIVDALFGAGLTRSLDGAAADHGPRIHRLGRLQHHRPDRPQPACL